MSLTPTIHDSAFVAEGARLVGDVTLSPESSVWYNAVLRGDNSAIVIGTRSNVQDGAIVHGEVGSPTVLGDFVSVAHGAIVHGCTIGDATLVGMGAIVLNGAQVGKCVLIGAGAVVPENMVIPDGVLVTGVPARIRRALTQEEIDSIRGSADDYLHLSRNAKAALQSQV